MANADKLPIDDVLVAHLIKAQAAHLAHLPLQRVASSGTDNIIYRLGATLSVRVPRHVGAIAFLSKELDWLPHLQGLPLDVPALRLRGNGTAKVAFEFGIFDWVEGQIAKPELVADWPEAAHMMADFLKALHLKETTGAPVAGVGNNRRGIALHNLADITLSALDVVADEVNLSRARDLWDRASTARFVTRPVWLHGDLKADNLVVRNGRLRGVIDWGLAAVGDPAADYATAWVWIDPDHRSVFRDQLEIEDDDWLRAQGWALYSAVIALSSYRGGKNEALCQQCRLTLHRLGLLL